MLSGTSNQFAIFAVCMLVGGGLAIIWLSIKWLTQLLKNNIIVKNILEFIFSGVCIISLFVLTVKLNFGIIRWYIILGCLVGFYAIKQFFAILLAFCKKKSYTNGGSIVQGGE